MTTKCSVYCGVSLDGFIAGPDGEIEWLLRPEYSAAENVGLTFEAFISTVDTLVMGRKTFEIVSAFPDWPYTIPVVVLSTKDVEVPPHLQSKVRTMAGEPREIVSRLASEDSNRLYIDGGQTIQSFLKARLIDEITVTYIPILLGAGISLFGSTKIETPLKLLEVSPFRNGLVQIRYQVVDPADA